MDSSPEMERFGISDADFEYMKDPLTARYKQSRKQRLYGVFASDDSASEGECSGFSGRDTKLKRKGANYSAPITFVSGGVKIGAKDVSEGSATDNKDIPISDDENDTVVVDRASDSESSPERNHSSRRRPKYPSMSVGAGRRAAVAAASSKAESGGFGAWEKHTRGIGMKLLEQMGYQPGKGLGSEGQGITTPVQATQRPVTKASVGYFGSESTAVPVRGSEITEPVKTSAKPDGPRYKKRSGQPSKSKYDYKSAEEIIAQVAPSNLVATIKRRGIFLENSEMSKVKVIDMTSKEQKVYSGYEAALLHPSRYTHKPAGVSAADDGPDAQREQIAKHHDGQFFDCPALRQNLGLILRSCEQEIRKLDRTARFEEDRCVALEHEIEKLEEIVKTESVETEHLRVALDLIDEFETEIEQVNGGLPPEKITQWMTRIRKECSELPEMPVLMAAIARPMLDASLAKWKPLSDPGFCFQLMSKWQELFQNALAFDVVLESSWLNTLRRTIVNDWDPRDCEPLLAVLEVWRCLLPEDMLEQRILNELVLPKLQNAVSYWNPLTDTIPIHTWLHPWLPWFGGAGRLAAIHEMVLLKLSNCLSNWHPSDGSAHAVLTPWRSVISVSSMSAFLNRNIVPKLSLTMQQFKLNPAAQNMDAWNWVMRWADLVGPAIMANILDQHFWPRWLLVLSNWLEQGVAARQRGDHAAAGQVYQEVGRWYAGWKGQLPPECVEYAGVKDALTQALAMMERAMRGLPPQQPKPAGAAPVTRSMPPSSSFGGAAALLPSAPSTLRKQVEQVAAQRGLTFYPISSRTFEGQQVYCLERVQVFFDRNVSFVLNPTDGTWHPVSFSELMAKAEQ